MRAAHPDVAILDAPTRRDSTARSGSSLCQNTIRSGSFADSRPAYCSWVRTTLRTAGLSVAGNPQFHQQRLDLGEQLSTLGSGVDHAEQLAAALVYPKVAVLRPGKREGPSRRPVERRKERRLLGATEN